MRYAELEQKLMKGTYRYMYYVQYTVVDKVTKGQRRLLRRTHALQHTYG